MQNFVEHARACIAAIHRTEDLNVLDGIDTVCLRQAGSHQAGEYFRHLLIVFNRDKVKIAFFSFAWEKRHYAGIDLMRFLDDPGRRRLSENLGK